MAIFSRFRVLNRNSAKTLNMIGDPVLLKTCHKNDVNDIVFPANKNELFATAGVGDVRIWQTTTGKELRRIEVSIILGVF